MKNRYILWAMVALLAQSAFAFTKMDITRVLLMNDDTNETWAVSGQGYYCTNDTDEVYWEHSDEPTPQASRNQALWKLNVLPGINHTLYQNGYDADLGPVKIKLWQLNECRAGSPASRSSTASATASAASGARRNFIPWSVAHSVPFSGTSLTYLYAGMVSMLNSTNSWIVSPLYDNIGTIYADAVNGWTGCSGDIVVQVATETLDGSPLTAASEIGSLVWRAVPFSVFAVKNKNTVSEIASDVTSFTLNQNSTSTANLWGGYFYRIRATLNWRYAPIRFRIRRTSVDPAFREKKEDPNGGNYLILDNIVVSYAPVEADLCPYGEYAKSRRGSSVIGREGVFSATFPYVNQENVSPIAYFRPKENPYAPDAAAADFTLSDTVFHYRWRYLDQIVGDWRTIDLEKLSDNVNASQYVGNAAVDLSSGVGDLEFYYTFTQEKAPHYEPMDFALDLAEPYGAGWVEGGTPWSITNRCSEETALASGITEKTRGSDWFVRLREGASEFRDVSLALSFGEPGVDDGRNSRTIQMSLTGDHSWRAFVEVDKDSVGSSMRFQLHAVESVRDGSGSSDVHTYWAPAITTNSVLPCSAIAEETILNYGETILDGLSGHVMVEYNDATHTVTLTRGEYQNFNLWTDANMPNNGYVGYSTDTNSPGMSGVSPDKRAYPETFDKWQAKEAKSVYWMENFSGGVGDTGFPFNEFFSKHKTPNGWAAENVMFVTEQYSAAYVTNGMALQLEGRGKGFVQFADAAYMPDGLDTFSFTARAAQFLEFDDFAYYLDGTSFDNYAVGGKITFTNKGSRDRDVSPGAPSMSLVGYYRPTKGCYELRLTRVKSDKIEMALYRWNKSGKSVTSTRLAKKEITAGESSAQSLWPTGTATENSKWTSVYLAVYNGTGRTHIKAALANQATTYSLSEDSQKGYFTNVLEYEDTDANNRHVKGSYGVGSCDSPARFGRIAQYDVENGVPKLSVEKSTAAELKNEDNWALPPGRMEMIDDMPTTWGWSYGIKACNPEQSVDLYLAKTGSGNDWVYSGYSVAVTSFVAKVVHELSPRLVDTYNVRLSAGGDDNDARTDVVVDDLELTQWHSGSWGDWSEWTYPIAYTNWVYEQCWIEALADFSDPAAYELKTLSDTEEFVYIFTNSCTFTPSVDLELNRILVVGGGGGGGSVMGGGGGGGCVVDSSQSMILRAGYEYTVTVGAGGTAITGNNQNAGGNGGDSSLKQGATTLFSARGGGGGQGWSQQGTAGGNSGGSANRRNITTPAARTGEYGGHKGGDSGNGRGGGGAGAGADGGVPDHGWKDAKHASPADRTISTTYGSKGGNGGDGVISDITGSAIYYGGGGGGGIGWAGTDASGTNQGHGGDGGKGGGGRGSNAKEGGNKNVRTAQSGEDGKGGGGGGGTWWDQNGWEGNTGGRGGSGTVILRLSSGGKLAIMHPRRSKPNQAVMLRSPYLNGISLFSFSFQNADSNANLRLQMATNSFGSGDFRALSQSLTDPRWIELTNFTFKTQSSGTYTYFIGLREPVWGFVRLLCDPSKVYDAATNNAYAADDKYKYGSVSILSAIAYDEPMLDDRSWFGWNMRTTDDSLLSYLPDPSSRPAGLAGALNYTGKKDDPTGNYADELAASNNAYAQHDPFIQSPAIYNEAGVGQIQFRARVMDTNATVSSWVSLYGSSDSQADDEDWALIKNFEITNRTFRIYQWKTTDDVSPFKTVRLAVHAAKYGRDGDDSKTDGKPLAKPIQRVLLDEFTVTEPVAPGLSFAAVSPFRTNLDQEPVKFIPNAKSMDQQPLLGESFGVQVEVALAQLADELDMDSIRVFMAYYPKPDPWGYAAWSNSADAVTCELAPCSDTNLVWRSSYAAGYEDSIIPPQQDSGDNRGAVVQYYVWAEYKDTSGTNHSHRVLSTEWSNPAWYYPIDYNKENGASSDETKFCPYTILQTISPKRAWINCMNLFDGDEGNAGKNQYLEMAVPSGIDMPGWYLRFTEQSLGNTTTFAILGAGGVKSEKTSVNVYNSYDFLTLQSPATTQAKGTAADGTWFSFSLEQDSAANGSFRAIDSYAVELIRPNGIKEHQIVIGGTNMWEEYIFWKDYDPGALRDKLAEKDAGTDANWVLAGADKTDGSVGVMVNHGAVTNDWEVNLAQTSEARNRRRNGTYQTIPANWYIHPSGTNYWIYSYLFGGYISQQSGKETGDAIRLIVPKGTTTNITYTVEPWHRIGTMLSNDVAIAAPPYNSATRTYNYTLRDISENINLKVTSSVAPEIDNLIPVTDPYHDAVVRWLENFNCESNIVMAEIQLRDNEYKGKHLSLKEMYWLDIYPFQTNRLVVGVSPPAEHPIPEDQIDYSTPLPALTNMRVNVYMMITNMESKSGEAYAPYTIQGLSNESSATDYSETSLNWTSATFKVFGNLLTIEGKWRPLRYFVFDHGSFRPKGDPAGEFTADIEVWDPFSSKTPIYTDPDVRWWPYRGAKPVMKTMVNEELKPVRVEILKPVSYLTTDTD